MFALSLTSDLGFGQEHCFVWGASVAPSPLAKADPGPSYNLGAWAIRALEAATSE